MLYIFLLCVLFCLGNLIRGYTKTRYFCLLFWPCPLLKLSPLLLFFHYKFVNKFAFLLDAILGVSAHLIYVMAGPRRS